MKLFLRNNVNKGVLTYFKDVFLAGRLNSCPAFFNEHVLLRNIAKKT